MHILGSREIVLGKLEDFFHILIDDYEILAHHIAMADELLGCCKALIKDALKGIDFGVCLVGAREEILDILLILYDDFLAFIDILSHRLDIAIDLTKAMLGVFCEFSHFISHHGKAPPMLARPRGLDGGV